MKMLMGWACNVLPPSSGIEKSYEFTSNWIRGIVNMDVHISTNHNFG
jgi:hypothetical protein